MSLEIKKAEYFNITSDDNAGEAYNLLTSFAQVGVSLLAFKATPAAHQKMQYSLFPNDSKKMAEGAKKAGLTMEGPYTPPLPPEPLSGMPPVAASPPEPPVPPASPSVPAHPWPAPPSAACSPVLSSLLHPAKAKTSRASAQGAEIMNVFPIPRSKSVLMGPPLN